MGLFKKPWEIEYESIGDPKKREKARSKAISAVRCADAFDKLNIAMDATKYPELRMAAIEGLRDNIKAQADFATNYTDFTDEMRAFARANTTEEAIIEDLEIKSVAGWLLRKPAKNLMMTATDPAFSQAVRRRAVRSLELARMSSKDFEGVPREVVAEVYEMLRKEYPTQSLDAFVKQLGLDPRTEWWRRGSEK